MHRFCRRLFVLMTPVVLVFASSSAQAATLCIAPDNGSGTANLPACDYPNQDPSFILDGLPPGTTVEIDPSSIGSYGPLTITPGGSLGGEMAETTAFMPMQLTGTGSLAGYSRFVNMPLSTLRLDAAPRVNGSPVQSFDQEFYYLQGQITGDPDFDLLRITGGSGYGMPSPGHTTLTQSGPNWAVDSFFDITYRIDFVGHPGGPFSGRSGSTTGTYRYGTPEPAAALLLAAAVAFLRRHPRRVGT